MNSRTISERVEGSLFMKQLCVCVCVFLGRGLLFFGLLYPHLTPMKMERGWEGRGSLTHVRTYENQHVYAVKTKYGATILSFGIWDMNTGMDGDIVGEGDGYEGMEGDLLDVSLGLLDGRAVQSRRWLEFGCM